MRDIEADTVLTHVFQIHRGAIVELGLVRRRMMRKLLQKNVFMFSLSRKVPATKIIPRIHY